MYNYFKMYDYDVLVDKYDEKCYEIVKLKRILKVFLNDDAETSKISCMLLGNPTVVDNFIKEAQEACYGQREVRNL